MPALVFLSHSSKDDETVTRIHDAIEAATHEDVWVDHRDLVAGDRWQPKIDEALAKCTHMLVILSKEAVKSAEVEAEWRDGLLRGKALLPVVIDELELTAIPSRLRTIQSVNLAKDWDGGIKQLSDVIGRAHKGTSAAGDFLRWPVTGMIDRMLTSIPISGREQDIETVQRYLKQAPTSILGVGGLGKSRLAAEIVVRQSEADGAVWHVCGEYSTAEDVYDLLREHLGLEATTATKEILKRLRQEHVLVVLDNAESIGEKEARRKDYIQLVNDLHATQGVDVLLTSRTAWEDIKASKQHQLTEPEAVTAEKIVKDMAAFFEIKGYKTEDYAAELAKAARYHPRLIEWAVGKLRKFEPVKVIGELGELKGKDIQAMLDAMIRQTVMQMTAEEGDKPEAALRQLVVCRGGFTYEAAGAILTPSVSLSDADESGGINPAPTDIEGQSWDEDTLDEVLDALMGWQFVRLVVTERGQTRYTIEPLVTAAVTADESAYQTHFEYYQALAWLHDEKQDYLGLAAEADNLEMAFEWAMQAGEYEKAYWFTNATSFFLANRGHFEQRKNWLERVAEKLRDSENELLLGAVQNSLGVLYQEHPLGDKSENLKRAVQAYEAVLQHYTPEAAPLDYATIQNNLGTAYSELAEVSEREANLKRAVQAYEAALQHYTPEAAPLDYAMTQSNLGTAYRDLAQLSESEANLKRALAAYQAALVYGTPEAAPLDYATTQNNLGIAYRNLSEFEDQEANLKRALAAYQAALVYRTPEAAPLAYAMTRRNLGNAYEDLEDLKQAIACWREAEVYYRQMGVIDNANLMLKWIEEAEGREHT
ncbi:MAG: TIR domain-containing protein [Anaerolineaceae bacterium]|nr:TIR domain-containing protein [Anaerolineaceae bacterium]